MNRRVNKILVVFLFWLIQATTISHVYANFYANAGLEIKLSMPQNDYFADDQLMLDMTITNTTNDAITFLKWNTPFENGFTEDMLTIQHEGDGQLVRYIGKIMKRAPPEESDFITVAGGETISTSIDISEGYAIENRGDYTIAFNQHLHIANNFVAKNLSANVAFKKVGVLVPVVGFKLNEERHVALQAKQSSFSSCSSNQQSILDAAHLAAIRIAEEARDILMNTEVSARPTTERYTTWFGRHTSARYSTVTTHFAKISDGLANQKVDFLCECNLPSAEDKRKTFAYVFTTRPYQIYLCDAFWRADLNGTNSQAGTLVHEISHFIVVAQTKDHAVGTIASKRLAINLPNLAVNGADNFEYFAENTPVLSMEADSATINTGLDSSTESSSSGGGGGNLSIELLLLLVLLGLFKLRRADYQ